MTRNIRVCGVAIFALVLLASATISSAETGVEDRTPRKVALLIGISDYAHFDTTRSPSRPLADLRGPQNDVARMRVSLLNWGFGAPEDTRTLLGPNATRANILSALRWLSTRATDSSDAVIVFYSGHGSYAADTDGDEPDGRDEGLVPFDAADAHAANQLVIDDDIRKHLSALATRNVTVIIDACYSGTVTRGAGDAAARPKGALPPRGATTADVDRAGDFTEARGHTLITAARSHETAEEMEFEEDGRKVWLGALTYNLTRALDGAVATRALRYDELVSRLRSDVRGLKLKQIPQLEGDESAVVFRSHHPVAARPFVMVTASRAGRVTLDAGAIHGVRRSAVYDIFPATDVLLSSRPTARVRVDSVVEAESFARIISSAPDTAAESNLITKGTRAVLARVPVGASELQRLRVHFDRTATRLATSIARDKHRFVLTGSRNAFATVTRRRGVTEVLVRGVPLPPQPTDRTDTIMWKPRPAGPSTVSSGKAEQVVGYKAESICAPLIRALSIAAMEGIVNPAPPADLFIDVRAVPSGSGEPNALPDSADLEVAYIGEKYDFYVRVDVPSDVARRTRLYLTAAVAGYTSDPLVLWPESEEEQSPVPLNQWVRIAGGIEMAEPAGSEIIKVVVNSDQYDLRGLVESLGSCDKSRNPSDSSAEGADAVAPITGWTAYSRRLDILRR